MENWAEHAKSSQEKPETTYHKIKSLVDNVK